MPPQCSLKVGQKFGIAVKGDAIRNSVQTHNLLEEQMSYLYNIICLFVSNKVSHLGKSINYYHNGINSLRARKFEHKVHKNISPGMFKNWEESIEFSVLTLSFTCVANLTSFQTILHIFLELGPRILLLYHEECFVTPQSANLGHWNAVL